MAVTASAYTLRLLDCKYGGYRTTLRTTYEYGRVLTYRCPSLRYLFDSFCYYTHTFQQPFSSFSATFARRHFRTAFSVSLRHFSTAFAIFDADFSPTSSTPLTAQQAGERCPHWLHTHVHASWTGQADTSWTISTTSDNATAAATLLHCIVTATGHTARVPRHGHQPGQ
eukprot:scaffold121087_cov18-Prasinocladus_malaysianus.AAC.1